jgi:uncharacterized membrane protein
MKNITMVLIGFVLAIFGLAECMWLGIYTALFLFIGAFLITQCYESAEKEFNNWRVK